MKNTINGFRQDKLIENKLDLADSLILRLFADMYSSNSSKIEYQILEYEVENEKTKEKTLEKDKFMWVTYDYLYSQIPLVGSKSTFIRKVGELVEKGILKKQIRNSKKGKKGTFLYISFGEKFSELTEYETEDTPTQNDNEGYPKREGGLPNLDRGATQNDKEGYSKWVDKDSTITDSSLIDSSIRDKKKSKKRKLNNIECYVISLEKDENYKQLLFEFIKYRKEIKKSLKTTSPLKALVKEFPLYDDLKEALEIMAIREWRTATVEWIENYKNSLGGNNNAGNTGNNGKKGFDKHNDYKPDYSKGFEDWN